jgi:16S rRNA (guanine1207-N2)-methyltransferase
MTPTATLLARAAPFFRSPLLWVLPEPEAGLKELASLSILHSFRPDVLALARLGLAASPDWPDALQGSIALTLPRQFDWAMGLAAAALDRLPAGGMLLAAAENDAGGRRYAKLLGENFELAFAESKNHCRLVALERPAALPAIVAEWRANYAPRLVTGTALRALPGAFSCDHVDPGSALLAQHLPPLEGRVADFGAGWGYLSHLLLHGDNPPAQVDLYEADFNALGMARLNLAEDAARAGFFWHDLLSEPCPHRYDAIVMNPPFHSLRAQSSDIGQGFIRAAAAALNPGGELWMVANRHLPYEQVLAETFGEHRTVTTAEGFKFFHARR